MNLKNMRSFVVLADELHFGRAAALLNIVQPALTQHIHQLEDELGTQLLERSSRKICLTEAGQIFFREARRAIQQVEFAHQSVRDAIQGEAGRLTIGFVDSAVWSVFPGTIRAFRTKFPKVDLDLRELARGPQMAALTKGELDIGILPAPVETVGIVTQKLSHTVLDLMLPAGHRLGDLDEVPITALAKEPFVTFTSATDVHRIDEIIQALCMQAGFTPILGQAVHQMHTALALVSTGIGVAIVPRWMRKAWSENVIFRPLLPTTSYELLMATMEIRERPIIALFRQTAKKFLDETDGAGG